MLKLLMIHQKILTKLFWQISCGLVIVEAKFLALKPSVNCCAVPHTSSDSSSLDCFWLMFTDKLLNIQNSTTGHFCWWIYRFLGMIILMGHDVQNAIKDYWSTNKPCCTPVYSEVKKRDRFMHVMKVIHFEKNQNPPDRTNPECDRLWKIRRIFSCLNSIPYILESNPHPNLIRTQFLATS
jgi:hypothetical protein